MPPEKDPTYEIVLDVPFRPYERVRQNYWPKKGENPAIFYERYNHTLLLRRKLHSMESRGILIL